MPTVGCMEADYGKTEQGATAIGATPHLHEQPLLVLL